MNKRMGNNFIINIGRQLGSGGREIGEKLAARLGIDFYDKELIRLASEESGLCCEFFEKADEKASQGIIGGLFGMRFPFVSDGAIPATNCLSNDALFKVQSDVIRRLAEEKSCVFVGRCADYILRDNPRCVNVFISCFHLLFFFVCHLSFFLLQSLGKRKCKHRADGYRQPYVLSIIHLLSIPIVFYFCLSE